MQYLLTKEELDALTPKTEVAIRDEVLAVARVELLKALDYGCWHDVKRETFLGHSMGYCDDCPIGSHDGAFGLKSPVYHKSKLLCTLSRNYSK